MPKQFQVKSEFPYGYNNKRDLTNLKPGTLINGSQNVLSNDGDRIASRKGYTLDGTSGSGTFYGSYVWKTNRGVEHALRRYDDVLEVRYGSTWYTLKTGLAITGVNKVFSQFAEFWDNTQKIDELLITDGTDTLRYWTGAVATFASATVNTVTLEGTETWAQKGITVGGGTIVIGGVSATYTGGESTTTLTGVTVNFSATAVGTVIFEGVRTAGAFISTNTVIPSGYKIDLIATLNNQIYIGNLKSRDFYISKVNSFTDYSKSSPRVTGEGEVITLDAALVGFIVGDYRDDQTMNATAGEDFWYVILFSPSADQTRELATVRRLKTPAKKAAKVQSAIGSTANDIIFISNEPTMDTLGRADKITTSTIKPLSDPIKLDFDGLNFTDAQIKYFKNYIYVTVPQHGILYMYNIEKGYWEPPQTIPVQGLAVIGGELYGHAKNVKATYKLFSGYNDNGNPMLAIASFSYENAGTRTSQKLFTEYYVEGYIIANTTLTMTLNYDYKGFGQQLTRDISGSNEQIILNSADDFSLGINPLGTESLGGGGDDIEALPPKFRVIETFQPFDVFEHQVIFSSNDTDQRWELLAFGAAETISTFDAVSIKI